LTHIVVCCQVDVLVVKKAMETGENTIVDHWLWWFTHPDEANNNNNNNKQQQQHIDERIQQQQQHLDLVPALIPRVLAELRNPKMVNVVWIVVCLLFFCLF
jgi:hypothetical protein